MTMDRTRARLLLGWATLMLGGGLAACDSPTLEPRAAGGPSAVLVPGGEMIADTFATLDTMEAAADVDTTSLFDPDCRLSTACATTGTTTVAEPGGNVTIGTYGATWTTTIASGGNNYDFTVGVTGGSFIGIINKGGTFQGYWGYCLFIGGQNYWYKTTENGKTYIHWENHEPNTSQMYHYIYDPSTNTLKVYHRQRDGSTRLIYQGAPIKTKSKLPPPDPAAGAGPHTNENQWTTGVPVPPAVPAPTGGGTTGTTTGSTAPTSTTTNSPTSTSTSGFDRQPSTGGYLVRP